MAKKCCKSDPPCKDCPKRKKKKKHGHCGACDTIVAVDRQIWPIFKATS